MPAPNFVLKSLVVGTLASLLLGGCASTLRNDNGNTTNLADLQQMAPTGSLTSTSATTDIRLQALQDTALSLGAQAGLAWRAQQINALLADDDKTLSTAFDFHRMILEHSVLPPVLSQSQNTLNVADDATIRLADHTYKIVSQARFVSAPPHWRDYLWFSYSIPERPDNTLLPRSGSEQAVWKRCVTAGWEQGVAQANAIFADNLARLRRDYDGMILYRSLLAQRMVSAPFVARSDLGVTGTDTDLRINDQVLRITAMPALQTDSTRWKAGIRR